MNTPIHDFLKKYADDSFIRLHMPGHKGRGFFSYYSHDITEISGADSLFESSGVIAESEKNAASLFGSLQTCFSTGGSTLCIQAMLAMAKLDGRTVIAVRNVHRSFLSACALLGIEPEWIYPEYSGGILSGSIDINNVKIALSKAQRPCLYITSPDYLGRTADIRSLSNICKSFGALLIVDNAHGAHFAGEACHPIKSGADMCCDSAHKMLPALTGAAYLHIGNKSFIGKAKQAMSLFGSTSPSYLIMDSLDLCNDYIENRLFSDRERVRRELKALRKRISLKYNIYDSEEFHLTLLCDGNGLADKLRRRGIECEYSDKSLIVLLFSPCSTDEEIKRTGEILLSLDVKEGISDDGFVFPVLERKMTVRDAVLSTYETVKVENSVGRICASVNVPCPPAVPIAVSGEVISHEAVKIYKRYGISDVNVVK